MSTTHIQQLNEMRAIAGMPPLSKKQEAVINEAVSKTSSNRIAEFYIDSQTGSCSTRNDKDAAVEHISYVIHNSLTDIDTVKSFIERNSGQSNSMFVETTPQDLMQIAEEVFDEHVKPTQYSVSDEAENWDWADSEEEVIDDYKAGQRVHLTEFIHMVQKMGKCRCFTYMHRENYLFIAIL